MSVLITGATGTIGRVLTRSLAAAGLPVRVLTRRPHRAFEAFGEAIPYFEWHPISEPVPPEAVAGVETIVHLMGDPIAGRLTAEKRQRLRQSRLVATGRLIEAIGTRPVRFIAASCVGVCGTVPDTAATPASVPAGSGVLADCVQACEEAMEPVRRNGGSLAQVRLALVLSGKGIGSGTLEKRHARRLLATFTDEASVPAIALEDAAALFAWLVLNRKVGGIIDAAAPEPLSGKAVNDYLAVIADGRRGVALPQWFHARSIGAEAELLFANARIEPSRLLQAGFVFSHPDPAAALAAIGSRLRDELRPAPRTPAWLRQRRGASSAKNDNGAKSPRGV